jgi:hypothetical protein
VGTFTPIAAKVMRIDKAGQVWTVPMTPKAFTVTKDQTVTLAVPEKINVKAGYYPIEKTAAGRVLRVQLMAAGSAGEAVGSEIKVGPTRVPAPQFQIIDSKGALLQSGNFEYG